MYNVREVVYSIVHCVTCRKGIVNCGESRVSVEQFGTVL